MLDAARGVGRRRSRARGRTRIVVAGAPPPTRTIERVETELGWEFIQIYGLTETSPLLTMNRSRAEYDDAHRRRAGRQLGRAGAPALGVRAVDRRQGEVLAAQQRGDGGLLGAARGRPPTRSVDGWFHTGDGGSIDDENYLAIADRKKDVIISGGENVSSIEVEDCIFSHPAVVEVAVIGVPHEKWGETVIALVVVAPGSTSPRPRSSTTAAHGSRTSSARRRWSSATELARTATGKLQKFKLRAPYWEGRERLVN